MSFSSTLSPHLNSPSLRALSPSSPIPDSSPPPLAFGHVAKNPEALFFPATVAPAFSGHRATCINNPVPFPAAARSTERNLLPPHRNSRTQVPILFGFSIPATSSLASPSRSRRSHAKPVQSCYSAPHTPCQNPRVHLAIPDASHSPHNRPRR